MRYMRLTCRAAQLATYGGAASHIRRSWVHAADGGDVDRAEVSAFLVGGRW